MPFESCFARSLNALTVEREAPAASGVYGISNSRRWIFIEDAENIRASLMVYLANHAARPNDLPAGFSFELVSPHSRGARRDRLIAELEPHRNLAARPLRARARVENQR